MFDRQIDAFPVEGEFGYFCIPSEGVGMNATLEVTPGGGAPSGPSLPTVPESARNTGIAVAAGLISSLFLTYDFLKYDGSPPRND